MRTCKNCGKQYDYIEGQSFYKFCSVACQTYAYEYHPKKVKKEVACEVCGKIFKTYWGKICSRSCLDKKRFNKYGKYHK